MIYSLHSNDRPEQLCAHFSGALSSRGVSLVYYVPQSALSISHRRGQFTLFDGSSMEIDWVLGTSKNGHQPISTTANIHMHCIFSGVGSIDMLAIKQSNPPSPTLSKRSWPSVPRGPRATLIMPKYRNIKGDIGYQDRRRPALGLPLSSIKAISLPGDIRSSSATTSKLALDWTEHSITALSSSRFHTPRLAVLFQAPPTGASSQRKNFPATTA